VKCCTALLHSSFVNIYLGLKLHISLDLLLKILQNVAVMAAAAAALSVVVVSQFQDGLT
jgi:hypothetical protein